ncbi:MAG: alpha/beta fold hydrolase, partial [Actinobacteria bacterium]|nr:alpha/beta fold hydrolase [Actinomycetota bacterium]
MKVLQTPDSQFEGLADWPYQPIYTMIDATSMSMSASDAVALRVHHIDARPQNETSGDGVETVLCMHGEPSWSYLYRKMIPRFVAAGHRVVAPDLIGFGRSDKPTETTDYTYERHVDWMTQWL